MVLFQNVFEQLYFYRLLSNALLFFSCFLRHEKCVFPYLGASRARVRAPPRSGRRSCKPWSGSVGRTLRENNGRPKKRVVIFEGQLGRCWKMLQDVENLIFLAISWTSETLFMDVHGPNDMTRGFVDIWYYRVSRNWNHLLGEICFRGFDHRWWTSDFQHLCCWMYSKTRVDGRLCWATTLWPQ